MIGAILIVYLFIYLFNFIKYNAFQPLLSLEG